MVTYLLDFHENNRFSKTLSEKSVTALSPIVFLDPPKKCM